MYIALIDSSPYLSDIISFLKKIDLIPVIFTLHPLEIKDEEVIECDSLLVTPSDDFYRVIFRRKGNQGSEECIDFFAVLYAPSCGPSGRFLSS